jgi:hypothetical protein
MKNLTMLEAVTSCMRAVVQKLADLQSPKVIVLFNMGHFLSDLYYENGREIQELFH